MRTQISVYPPKYFFFSPAAGCFYPLYTICDSNAKNIFQFQYTGTIEREIIFQFSVYPYPPTRKMPFSFSIPVPSNAKTNFQFEYTHTIQRENYISVSVYRCRPTRKLSVSFSIPIPSNANIVSVYRDWTPLHCRMLSLTSTLLHRQALETTEFSNPLLVLEVPGPGRGRCLTIWVGKHVYDLVGMSWMF